MAAPMASHFVNKRLNIFGRNILGTRGLLKPNSKHHSNTFIRESNYKLYSVERHRCTSYLIDLYLSHRDLCPPQSQSQAATRTLHHYPKQRQSHQTERDFGLKMKPTICSLKLTNYNSFLRNPLFLSHDFAFSTASTPPPTHLNSMNNMAQERIGHVMQMYEDFVGLTEVKDAQNKVVAAEQKFLAVQEDRRTLQAELAAVQSDVRTVAAELEKTSRTDSRYIDLVKREHETLLIEKDMTTRVKVLDKAERDLFALLSAALRESHEKERSRAERTKYWSVIGSIIGAVIGIVGSTINNVRRMRELRAIVSDSGDKTVEYKSLVDDAVNAVKDQQSKLDGFLQSVRLVSVGSKGGTDIGHVVYTGPEVEKLLIQSEERLQTEIRKNVLGTTAVVGGVVALGVAVAAFIMKGSS